MTQSMQKDRYNRKAPTDKSGKCLIFKWAHLGSNQGPPDYESGALTN